MHHIFACLFVSLNFVIPKTGLDVCSVMREIAGPQRMYMVLFLHYPIYSKNEECHLQTTGFGAYINCPGWVTMKYVIYPLILPSYLLV